jgi:choline dehydrogenase
MKALETTEFDYVVIGAGSAGCVLASRLTEDRDVSVLLLDAGASDKQYFYRRPGALAIVYQVPQLKKKADWGYVTEPQTHADNRRMPWTRSKILGGCSSVNGMIYIRGNRANYDEWRDVYGCEGWGYDDVLPLFKRSEGHEEGASEFHGGDGPLQVSRQQGCSPISDALLESISTVCGVPRIDDFNGAQQEGASIYQMTCANRRRSSTAVAFLYPALERPNFYVQYPAHVTRLTMDGTRCTGVEYTVGGERRTATAKREVILSAGVINSPQILMLSGMGPADHLREHGIDVVADLPGVGENLQDHLMVPLRFHTTKDNLHTSTALHFIAGMLNDFFFNRGWYGKTFLEGGAFVKSTPDQPVPDIQFHSIPWAYPEPNDDQPETATISKEHAFTMLPGLIYPKSRGHLRLKSADPNAAPLIDPRYLSDDDDVRVLLRGIELAREFTATAPMSKYILGERFPGPQAKTEADLRAHIRLACKTIFHPVGTCAMGIGDDAVVDPQLRVRGVENLRIADASVMPRIVGGNTNAPSIMIGEKCADLVRGRC